MVEENTIRGRTFSGTIWDTPEELEKEKELCGMANGNRTHAGLENGNGTHARMPPDHKDNTTETSTSL